MVADKLVSGISSLGHTVGSTIKDTYHSTGDNITNLSYSIKDKVTFHHRDYDKDDDLILHYEHDLKQSIIGLKFIISQHHKLSTSYYPKVLDLHARVVQQFIILIGPNSLSFKGIEKFYQEWDKYEALQEVPHVHPKEQQFEVNSVNEQLFNYLSSIEGLRHKISLDWEINDQSIQLRVGQMRKYLKDTVKLIKKRNKKRTEQDIAQRKIEKIKKKTGALSAKEENQLNKLEEKYQEIDQQFAQLNQKAISILPHVISYLNEFIETITKVLFYQQLSTYEEIDSILNYFTTFYGMADGSSTSYESIIDEWESNITATRIRIESFVSLIYKTNPELLNEEIDDGDKSLTAHKIWNKMNKKVKERTFKIDSKDFENGVFNDTLEIDPLDAFVTYQDPTMNVSQVYHPSKVINSDEVVPRRPIESEKPMPPPLPPRENTVAHSIYNISSFKSLPTTPRTSIISPMNNGHSNSSMESLLSHEDEESLKGSISSDSSFESSLQSDNLLGYTSRETLEKSLRKIYNSSKNEINEAPIPHQELNIHPKTTTLNDLSSATQKLDKYSKFFAKILKNPLGDVRVAKFDFHGTEPGDLSFNKGDEVEIVFDFQNVDTLYSKDNLNWLIGVSRVGDQERIGFVPNNYF